jgi:RNA polymerase primary sigma factor
LPTSDGRFDFPCTSFEALSQLRRTRDQLARELGRTPTPVELGARMSLTVDKVEILLAAGRQPVSLDTPVGEGDNTEMGDFLPNPDAESPEDTAIRHTLIAEVERVMAPLADREREGPAPALRAGRSRAHARRNRTPAVDHARARPADRSARAGQTARGAQRCRLNV